MRLHNRQIKAAFWTDSELIKNLSRDGRIFYLGLIQLADDSGCLEDDALAFKIHIFPADMDISPDMLISYRDKLIEMKKLILYTSDGKACLYIKNFHKHQTLSNPDKPTVPLPAWIKWTTYKSNSRAGKYTVEPYTESLSNNDLQSTYKVLTGNLQSPSNQNLNQNLLKPEEENVRACEDVTEEEKPKPDAPVICDSVKQKAEAEVFKFFNSNVGMITPFQTQTISQYLDDGLDPGMIIAVMQDSLGMDNRWSWIKKVLEDNFKINIRTKEQYVAHKLERANAKSRDKPLNKSGNKPPQVGNFEQRKYDDGYFDKLYKV